MAVGESPLRFSRHGREGFRGEWRPARGDNIQFFLDGRNEVFAVFVDAVVAEVIDLAIP